MWIIFFFIALASMLGLIFYLIIELNELDKKITTVVDEIRNHYESR